MKKYDIHNYEGRLKAAEIQLEKADICPRNKEIIFSFEKYLMLENISKPRILKYLCLLRKISGMLGKDFDKVDRNDIEGFVGIIQSKDCSEFTKKSYKVVLKKFYKWVKKSGDEYPPEVKWIKTLVPRNKRTMPKEGDLVKESEVMKIIETSNSFRDKALVASLWESGCRIGEIGNLSIGSISFDKYGTVLDVTGKTGQRRIRLICATSYLANWLNTHPLRNNKEAPLWVTLGNKGAHQICYRRISKILKELFQRAGINKKFNPHAFRHARATFLANHLTEFQMNQYFGWVQGSDMPSTYVHLSGRNTDNALLKLNGIEVENSEKESAIKPHICIRCDTINSQSSKFCCKCGNILDARSGAEVEQRLKEAHEQRSKVDSLMNQLVKDPSVMKLLAEKIKEIAG